MHSSTFVLAAGSLASVAAAAGSSGFIFPGSVPLSKRQTSGPAYQCHSDCGYAILDATGDYCSDSEWLDLLDGCLNCALEYEIWQYYSEGVTGAAEACGLDAVPVGGETTTTAAATSAAEETAAPTTADDETAAPTTTVEETSAVETAPAEETSVAATTSAEDVSSPVTTTAALETVLTSTEIGTVVPTTTSTGNATSTGPTVIPTAGAPQVWASGSLVAGAAIAVVAFFV